MSGIIFAIGGLTLQPNKRIADEINSNIFFIILLIERNGIYLAKNVNIKVKIPAGISEGEVIRLTGQGGAGELGAPAGDLYLKVRIKDDARFERDEYDIRTKADIDFVQAALGDKIDVETVEGVVKLKIPAGTQTSTIFKLRGKGITKLRGSGRGDQLIEVIVKTPSSLSRKQKSLFQELNL